jgi:predicted metalloprotease with PDZ domain
MLVICDLRTLVALVAAMVSLTSAAHGQGLLERLERRLEGVLGAEEGSEPAAAPTPAATRPDDTPQGYLGLTGDDRDEDGRGVRVISLREGSAAQSGGLRAGDLITATDGVAVTNLDDLERSLADKRVGDKVAFTIERGDKMQELAITLGRRPAPLAPEPADDLPAPRLPAEDPLDESRLVPTARASLGVTVAAVTEDARRRFGLSVRQGALISSVTAGGAADRAGLPVGGVVVAAQGRRIDAPEDLISLVQALRPGDEILLSYYRGATLFRKSVRLSETRPASSVVAAEPREAVREERPLLRRLEKALDAAAAPERPAPIGAGDDLRAEVDRLRSRVAELERRLADVEDRLAAPRADEDPAAEPPLRLAPPKEPPPRPEPAPAAR